MTEEELKNAEATCARGPKAVIVADMATHPNQVWWEVQWDGGNSAGMDEDEADALASGVSVLPRALSHIRELKAALATALATAMEEAARSLRAQYRIDWLGAAEVIRALAPLPSTLVVVEKSELARLARLADSVYEDVHDSGSDARLPRQVRDGLAALVRP